MSNSDVTVNREGRSDTDVARGTLDRLAEMLRGAAVEVLWRQWRALGGMAATHQRARSLVDPEALLLMTLVVGPSEPRLIDVLVDWVARNAELLSVQRVRNLSGRYPKSIGAPLADLANIAIHEAKDHRWRRLADGTVPTLERRNNKARATHASLMSRPALTLRLRLAFGVGIKADLLAFLLGTDGNAWTGITLLGAATGYTIAAVRKAVNDLVDARFIEQKVDTRTEVRADGTLWKKILGDGEFALWRGWNERFVFVAAFLNQAASARARPLTTYVLEARGADFLRAHQTALQWHRVWRPDSEDAISAENGALASAATALATWMIREA
jgi:hypothetical protein